MAKTKTAKRQKDIKSKLIAAICMLLVSTIMMVSSTYAWFTLSTAPEVTGITTQVGANGNLEMALMPKDGLPVEGFGIKTEVGDSTKGIEEKNITWGNLVDLSDSTVYGLDSITLYPSELNLADNDTIQISGILKTPTYGTDGRIEKLEANTYTGYYSKDEEAFYDNEDLGVRGIGTISGKTVRQLAYRNAQALANTAKLQGANIAKGTLDTHGSALANIAIKYGMDGTAATFGADDVKALRNLVDGLDDSVTQIEEAYKQYILAYAASAKTGTDDVIWLAVQSTANDSTKSLQDLVDALEDNGVTLPAEIYQDGGSTGVINKLFETKGKVEAAARVLEEELEAKLETNPDATFTWTEIKEAMEPLANPTEMLINGYKASEVKQNLGDLVSSVTAQGGIKVTMKPGAGVFADIADHCGDYWASVTIKQVEYNGIVLNDMTARMETATTANPVHLSTVGAAVTAAGEPSKEGVKQPISDFYGFIVDLAFRTNAAESKLLLQSDAADRIYDGNTNEETMGHGSSMTFAATTSDFSNDQVTKLMDAIRIVFFDPANGDVIAWAKLDTVNIEYTTAGLTAKIVLYTPNITYKEATGDGADFVQKITYEPIEDGETGEYISDGADGYRKITDGEVGTHKQVETYEAVAAGTGKYMQIADHENVTIIETNEIMALTQGYAHALSVLVYLDGNLVGNDAVAATAATSMTGKLNLQFASSAELVPMEYADLHIKGSEATTTATEASSDPSDPTT